MMTMKSQTGCRHRTVKFVAVLSSVTTVEDGSVTGFCNTATRQTIGGWLLASSDRAAPVVSSERQGGDTDVALRQMAVVFPEEAHQAFVI
jgi:hypothetical protein